MPRWETDEAFDAESDDTEHTPFPQPALTLFFLSGFLPIQRKANGTQAVLSSKNPKRNIKEAQHHAVQRDVGLRT